MSALCPLLTTAYQFPLFLPGTSPTVAPSSESHALRDRLIDVLPQIEALRNVGGTAGMSIGVMTHGHVLLDHNLGFADLERHLVANSSTRYPIASLTKAFVASTISQLVDEGLLEWDEALTYYIPELSFEHDPLLAGQLSLIDILSHRTGLARLDALWLGADSQTFIPKNFTVALCNQLPPIYPVRAQWLYNNWMYALAGQVIERVTNQSWGQVLATRVLGRLGLLQTTVIASEIPPDSLALPYMVLDNLTGVQIGKMDLTDGSIMTSAGGIRSTVGDLLTWGNVLLSLFRDEDVPLASLDTILSGHSFINNTVASDELYGMGFAKVITPAQFGKTGFNPSLVDAMPVIGGSSKPEQVFYHSGAGNGYNHCFMLIPGSQSVIVVLTNSVAQGDTADWVAQSLLQAVLDEKQPIDLKPFAKRAAIKWRGIHQNIADALNEGRRRDSEEPPHDTLAGRYWHKTRALYLMVFQEDGLLKFNLNGKPEQEHVLSHYSNDTFDFLPSAEERIRRGLFHYDAPAWLLHFKKDYDGKFRDIEWNLDNQSSFPENFVKEGS
ncbi:MAG: hypothetical protein Q9190_003971 [Brigantiaea leucoxantha]